MRGRIALSDRLRSEGLDCVLDQYEVSPPEGWPRWMERKITEANLVIVVCTEIYLNRVMGHELLDKGLGVKWEGNLIYQQLYNQGAHNNKFVPICLKESDRQFIPIPLQGASHFIVADESGYERLYARLLGRPPAEKPPLGQRRPLPHKDVKTDVSAYVMAPIDIDLWDKAEWKGTVFLLSETVPPILGIAFSHSTAAQKIFEGWQRRYGKRDEFEELRISFIEGEIPGRDPGYTVHIGVDLDNSIRRYREAGLSIEDDSYFALISRVHRMNPQPDSPWLSMFKTAYKKHGEYLLVPATYGANGENVGFVRELAISKRNIYFRKVVEIDENDPDSVIFAV
jgi:hypothetical protein